MAMRLLAHSAVVAVLAGTALPALARAQGYLHPTTLRKTGTFAAKQLTESSGVVVSRRHHGLLWTHNDSGHDPVLYATDTSGSDLGTVRIRGAGSGDWEDIAAGPCPQDSGPCLYIGDTGDNDLLRHTVTIYILSEPDRVPGAGNQKETTAHALNVRYTDGPHDVEALMIDGDGALWLFTKGTRATEAIGFKIPAADLLRDTVELSPAWVVDFRPIRALGQLVTAAASSPSGHRMVLRTYTQLFFYRRFEDDWVRDGPPCWLGLSQPQGEAVDFLDEETLVLTRERAWDHPGTIAGARCPTPGKP